MTGRGTPHPPRIAVAGAGPAGLACADALAAAGLRPTVFEKSRGIGGRVATRRRDGLQVDHGAQFLWLAEDDDLLRRARAEGAAAPWPAPFPDGRTPWLGTPRMKDVLAPLARGLEIRFGAEITAAAPVDGGWRLTTDSGSETFDAVAFAAPAPQILRTLTRADPALEARLAAIRFAPCHALMVAFDGPTGWPDLVPEPPDPFTLILRDSAKPGRPAAPDCILAHTTADWSAGHLDTAPDAVATELLAALRAARAPLPPVRIATGHRWRFSQPIAPLGAPYAESTDGRFLAGGDWALGTQVQDALASGRAMAQRLLARIAERHAP